MSVISPSDLPATDAVALASGAAVEAVREEAKLVSPAPSSPGGVGRRIVNMLPPLGVLALVIAGWYATSYFVMDAERRKFALPPLHRIVSEGFMDGEYMGEVMSALWNTTFVALVGLVVSIALGTLIAVAMAQRPWVERSLYPWVIFVQTIPILAIGPLMLVWAGPSTKSRIITCVLISIVPIIINTLFGLKSVERGMQDLFTLQNVSRRTRLFKLQLPSALPSIFTGLRIAAGLCVIGALVGEFFFRVGPKGLGQLIDTQRYSVRGPEMFTAVLMACFLGLVVFWMFNWISNRLLRSWHESVASH
jgi:NitT/TauT family transport system permease protein